MPGTRLGSYEILSAPGSGGMGEVYRATDVNLKVRALQVQAGDRLLRCSDGLTEMVTNDVIAATLAAEPEPEGAAKTLRARANEESAADTITLLVVRFDVADSNAANTGRYAESWMQPARALLSRIEQHTRS